MNSTQAQGKNKSSLKARTITACILVPFIILGIFLLPQISFGIVSAFIILFAATEWPRLQGKSTLYNSLIFVCLLIIFMALGLFMIQITGHTGWVSIIYFILVFLMWSGFFYGIFYFERSGELLFQQNLLIGLAGLLILLSCWLGLNIIRDVHYGKFFILYFLILIWGTDTVAYFSGRRWGKEKITPRVSPNKTWAGVWGALLFSLMLGLIGAVSFPLHPFQRLSLIPLSLIVAVFSIVGDLTISMFKRQQKLKDTGSLLPGHGGLLDRMDSLTAGAPIFALGLLLIGLQ